MGAVCYADSDRLQLLLNAQSNPRNIMLHIKLRDGFTNDTVSITVNQKEVYRKAGVTTNLAISFADSVDVPVDTSVVKLVVEVEGEQHQEKNIQVNSTPFVDVWIIDGEMELRESKDEVPML
jgi:hypothetical protein